MAKRILRWKNIWQEYVLGNWQYKLAAFTSALVIWVYVAGQQSMQSVVSAPVFFQNIPQGVAIADPEIPKVQVTISGRRNRMLGLKENQIWVAVNLNGMHLGKNHYQLSKKDIVVPAGIEVNVFQPRQLLLQLRPDFIATPIPAK